MDITQFYQTFFEEADELLAEMEQLLLALDPVAPDAESLNAIFRAAHSIKGGAATFGFAALTDTTHLFENLLDRARHGQLRLNRTIMDAFLNTKDALQTQLGNYRAGQEPDPTRVADICAVLQQLAREAQGGQEPAAEPVQSVHPVQKDEAVPPGAEGAAGAAGVSTPASTLKLHITGIAEAERRLLADELGHMGTVQAQTFTDDSLSLWLETSVSRDDLLAVCCFVVDESQVQVGGAVAAAPPATPAPDAPDAPMASRLDAVSVSRPGAPGSAAAAPPAKDSSIRVDVAKVDQIINLVGELVITQSMLAQTASGLDPVLHQRLLSGMGHLERNARDLQESVMSIRMMPMDYVFSRFPRLIRDLSAKLGKEIRLETEGRETELDKGLIERIIDPLTHLVRNSLDHGIETPERRVAAGKDPVGKLTLSAQHQGGSIVIEVRDDGAGLSRERILAKAMERGLPVSDAMSDDEVWQLIFAAGFSTAETVTDVSGRGVGMDVVRRNIQEMGGQVEIRSVQGQGTCMRIVLPLTLAILNGMTVQVGREVYILPLNDVIESLQPRAGDVHGLTADQRLLHVRGEYLPLVELWRLFDVDGAVQDPTAGIVVIVQAEGGRFALLVDQLVGQHQVVVKNLEANYRRVPGVSAATILGDGNVALIVDLAACRPQRQG